MKQAQSMQQRQYLPMLCSGPLATGSLQIWSVSGLSRIDTRFPEKLKYIPIRMNPNAIHHQDTNLLFERLQLWHSSWLLTIKGLHMMHLDSSIVLRNSLQPKKNLIGKVPQLTVFHIKQLLLMYECPIPHSPKNLNRPDCNRLSNIFSLSFICKHTWEKTGGRKQIKYCL